MQGKYENNPSYVLYDILSSSIEYAVNNKFIVNPDDGYDEIDNILKLILLNNGCKLAENEKHYQKIYSIMPYYKVYIISGMLGNDVNEYYDFITFDGCKILVVFQDYFNIARDYGGYIEDNGDLSPEYYLKKSMGNSVYYDAIKKIVEVFYLTFEGSHAGLLTTAMYTTQRWNGSIIAIHILDYFKSVDENDVSDISMEDINKILEGNIKLQLYGIRNM